MTYVECPRTNFKYLVKCYLKSNEIEDYARFETEFDEISNTPKITKWEYELEQPTVEFLIEDRYEVYKSSIKVMKQNETLELLRHAYFPWISVIQNLHRKQNIMLKCLQSLYPELLRTDN